MNLPWILRTFADAVDDGSEVTKADITQSITWRGGDVDLRLAMRLDRAAYDLMDEVIHGIEPMPRSSVKSTIVKSTKGGEPLTTQCLETVGFVLDTEWVVSCALPAIETLHALGRWAWTCPAGHETPAFRYSV